MKLLENVLEAIAITFLFMAGVVGMAVLAMDIGGFSLPHVLARPTEEIVLLIISSLTLA
ncbi:MAG: hypothetical protein ACRERU_14330 [Methylococcales bacterium]